MGSLKVVCYLFVLGLLVNIAVGAAGVHSNKQWWCKQSKQFGCWITYHQCMCGHEWGCENLFPYSSAKECWNDFYGSEGKCKKQPCRHGQCVQAKSNGVRKWQCECAGTGYYGRRCQYKCRYIKAVPLPKNYPVPCIF